MEDFLEQLASKLSQAAKKPNVLSYSPNSPVHQQFHESNKIGRILRGGNRSGKSTSGIVESIWRATGRHPYQKTHELPVLGRIVTVDNDNGIEQIIKPLLAQWTPPSELVNGCWTDSFKGTRGGKVMNFRNGSSIDLKTHQQEVESFAGVPRHFIHYDEECPQAIFNECRLRLIDYNGCWYMTMTPVEGQDWIFDRFIATDNKNVVTFEVDINDNPHLNKQALASLDEDLDEDEKAVRQRGLFVPKGGTVLKKFDYDRHVIGSNNLIPRGWSVYVSIDHGFNTPSAILWHAVSPDGDVVTFAEIYITKTVIKVLTDMIRMKNMQLGVEPKLYIGDSSMSQKTAESGRSPLSIYREHGIPLIQAKKDVAGFSIDKMNEYLEYDKWHITKDCPWTIKECRNYSFKIFTSAKIADRNNKLEIPNKKNDHCPDSCRYFFTLVSFLSPAQKKTKQFVSKTLTNPTDFPWEVDSNLMQNTSETLLFGEIY
jgi:phage terminase large subunit-like protein